MKKIWIVALMILLLSCTKPDQTKRILKANGYTNIEITGWRPFRGDRGDFFSTGFRATSLSGKWVTGTVSSGILKGATIRFD